MQRDYPKKIYAFYRTHRRMPTYSEIMEITGLRSRNAVFKLVNRLIAGNLVRKDAKGHLIPEMRLFAATPLLLQPVEAGFPSPAEEELVDTVSLDEFLIHNKEATVIAPVKGDSMIDAGIFEGDMVIIERNRRAKAGDIVVVSIDGDYTMKYFRTQKGRPYLDPANKKYQPIYPDEGQEVKIVGVVISVIRKYY